MRKRKQTSFMNKRLNLSLDLLHLVIINLLQCVTIEKCIFYTLKTIAVFLISYSDKQKDYSSSFVLIINNNIILITKQNKKSIFLIINLKTNKIYNFFYLYCELKFYYFKNNILSTLQFLKRKRKKKKSIPKMLFLLKIMF